MPFFPILLKDLRRKKTGGVSSSNAGWGDNAYVGPHAQARRASGPVLTSRRIMWEPHLKVARIFGKLWDIKSQEYLQRDEGEIRIATILARASALPGVDAYVWYVLISS